MGLHEAVTLFVTGLVGGAISTLIGGAALITFPVLLATGLSPVEATAVNMVAIMPGSFLAWIYDRKQLPAMDRALGLLAAISISGAVIGALLLLVTPVKTFALLVPLLLGFATTVFACSRQIGRWVERRAVRNGGSRPEGWGPAAIALFPVSIYGGYFGAGIGVLLIAALSIGADGNYRRTNVIKNFVASLNGAVACAIMIYGNLVVWPPALAMMAGALIGALAGARLAQVAPREPMRLAVIGVGALLTIAFAWRYWL